MPDASTNQQQTYGKSPSVARSSADPPTTTLGWIRYVRDLPLTGRRKHVLAAIATFTNQAGECWPSQQALALASGCTRQTVNKAIAELRADGDLIVTNRYNSKGQSSSMYQILFPVSKDSLHTDRPVSKARRHGESNLATRCVKPGDTVSKDSLHGRNKEGTKKEQPKREGASAPAHSRGENISIDASWTPSEASIQVARDRDMTGLQIVDLINKFRSIHAGEPIKRIVAERKFRSWVANERLDAPNGAGNQEGKKVTDKYIEKHAKKGESWQQARARLENQAPQEPEPEILDRPSADQWLRFDAALEAAGYHFTDDERARLSADQCEEMTARYGPPYSSAG